MGQGQRDPLGGDETATVPDRGPRLAPSPNPDEGSHPAEPAGVPERFEVRGELGRGGMGRVVEAFDRELDRHIAIKQMLSDADVDRARFEREIRITAKLEHPSIVPIHEAGRSADGTPYYVMRKIDGKALDRIVSKAGLAERLALVPNVLAACDAAAFAHAHQIIHRDIKPTNILVGPFGETLLIDWGLARELGRGGGEPGTVRDSSDAQLTRAGQVAGTPGFMSPEQARAQDVDARADVFALGATLFYVLAAEPPYAGTSATEMIHRVAGDRTPDWSRLPSEVPADLRAIVIKAMAPQPADRYADAGGLAADLRRFVTGNLVVAHRYTPFEQLVRFVRRHRGVVAVAAVSLAVLATGAVLSVRRIVAERDDANAARALAETRQREASSVRDQVLVRRALELSTVDPIASIAVLRQLPAESEHWREASVAALSAFERGIPFGFSQPEQDRSALFIGRDSRQVATISSTNGRVMLYDLIARTSREIAPPAAAGVRRAHSAAWLDVGNLAIASSETLSLVDVRDGARVELAIPGRTSFIRDGQPGVAWLVSDAHDAYRQVPDLTSLPPPAYRDVVQIEPLDDGRDAVLHTHSLEIVSAAERFTLATFPDRMAYVVADHGRLAVALSDTLIMYDLATRRELWRVPSRDGVPIAIVDGVLYVQLPVGQLAIVDAEHAHETERDPVQMWRIPHGLLTTFADGTIDVIDERGWFGVGKRPISYTRAGATADGRFIVAISNTGTVLAWDCAALRPQTVQLQTGENPLRLTKRSLWTIESSLELHRIDRATGATEMVIRQQITDAYVDPREAWGVLWNQLEGSVTAFDIPARRIVFHGVHAALAPDETGFVVAQEDGTIARWQPGWPAPKKIADAGSTISILSARGRQVAVALAGGPLVRIDTVSGRSERAELPGEAEDITIDPSGRVWAVISGEIWRWDHGTPPVRIGLHDRSITLAMTGAGMVARSPSWIAKLETTPFHVMQQSNVTWAPSPDEDRVPVLDSRHELIALDIPTELAIPISYRLTFLPSFLVSDGKMFAAGHVTSRHGIRVMIWNLGIVPVEPHALRTWLDAITNAKSFPNSEAIAWP